MPKAGLLFASVLLIGGRLTFAATPPAAPQPILVGAATDPRAAWAVIYLLNTAMLLELEAVKGAVDESMRDSVLASAAGKALHERVRFALVQAKAKSQMVPESLGEKSAELGQAKAQDSSSPAALAASFADESMRKAWTDLSGLYAAPMPTCPLTSDEVKSYADHQAQTLKGSEGSTGVSIKTLLAPIAGWGEEKRRCLALVLMGMLPRVKQEPGYEPLHLLAALSSSGMAGDLALRTLLATRYLQLGQYPESLRALVELTDIEPAFRLPYELVQRVFVLRQRGPGAVSLQGL